MKNKLSSQYLNRVLPFTLCLILTLFAIQPLCQPGFPVTSDGIVHSYRAIQVERCWRDGVFYSRLAPDMNMGYGSLLYNFTGAPFNFLAQGIHQIGFNYDPALKISIALIFMASTIGAYLFARCWFDVPAALLAAAAYTYAPFRLREAYFQGDYPQFLALAVVPFILWSIHRLYYSHRARYLAIIIPAYATLIMAHNITAMLSTYLIAAYVVNLQIHKLANRQSTKFAHSFLLVIVALALGVGISTFFWFPALGEKEFVRVELLRQGFFDVRHNFLTLKEIIAPVLPLDRSAINPPHPITLGAVQLLCALPALLLLRDKERREIIIFSLLTLSGAVALMLPISTPIWNIVPLLDYAEFPWRWMGVAALPLAMLSGAGAEVLTNPKMRWTYTTIALGTLIIAVMPRLYLHGEMTSLNGENHASMVRFEKETGITGTTSAGEFLPKGVEERPSDSPLVPLYAAGESINHFDYSTLPNGAAVTLLVNTARGDRYHVSTPEPFAARFYLYNYPGWRIRVDGAAVPIVADEKGFFGAHLPAGEYELSVIFEDTPLRTAANLASIVSLITTALVIIIIYHSKFKLSPEPASQPRAMPQIILIALTLGFFALKVFYVDSRTTWFRQESALDAIPDCARYVRINFDDKIRLLGYTVYNPTLRRGENLHLTLFWQAVTPMDKQFSTFVHLADPAVSQTFISSSDHLHPGGIPTDGWDTARYVRDDFSVPIALTTPPGVYQAQVGVYHQPTQIALPQAGKENREFILPVAIHVMRHAPPRQRDDYRLGDRVQLIGHRVAPQAVRAGESITVTLYWRATNFVNRNYTVFTHLVDENSAVRGQHDGMPVGNKYRTTQWQVGEIIEDEHVLTIDPAAPLGAYQVVVGMYDAATMQRLPAASDKNAYPDGAIPLEAVSVQPAAAR